MSKATALRKAIAPVTDTLRGWAFSTLALRRSRVDAARKILPTLPEWAQAAAKQEIDQVAIHCGKE